MTSRCRRIKASDRAYDGTEAEHMTMSQIEYRQDERLRLPRISLGCGGSMTLHAPGYE